MWTTRGNVHSVVQNVLKWHMRRGIGPIPRINIKQKEVVVQRWIVSTVAYIRQRQIHIRGIQPHSDSSVNAAMAINPGALTNYLQNELATVIGA